MKNMILKICGLLVTIVLVASGCGSSKDRVTISDQEKIAFKKQAGDTINIASDKTEYEIKKNNRRRSALNRIIR